MVPTPGAIEILPVNPDVVYVPTYDPGVVFVRPRPGFFVGAALHFGPGITIGAAFAPFGWSRPYLGWRRPAHERVERHDFHEDRRHDRH